MNRLGTPAKLACALALLCSASAVLAQSTMTASRTSSFTYQANGLLATETIEPGQPQLCVVTIHGYDAYGNRTSSTAANCSGATGEAVFPSRTNGSAYAAQTFTIGSVTVSSPAGQFATTATNALNQSETRVYDPRFGSVASLTGPNQLTTTVQYDGFGRKVRETRADGTATVLRYCILSSSGLNTSANSAGCSSGGLSGLSQEIPAGAVSYTQTELRNAADAQIGPTSRAYVDRAGRVIREVTEGFDGSSQPADRRYLAKDTQYNVYGLAEFVTAPFFLESGSSVLSGASGVGVTRTQVDALGRPVQIDTTDLQGGTSASMGNYGTLTVARTTVAYSGLTTTTTNAKGQTKSEEKNAIGAVVRVTDAYGAQVAYLRDAFDNLIATRDALGNVVSTEFDVRGRRLALVDPDAGRTEYRYNALGELVWQQSANQRAAGTATTMTYDVLGRMKTRVEPEYTSTWTYDSCTKGVGKLCSSTTTHGVSKSIVYDSLGRPSTSRTTVSGGPSFATARTYDSSTGRLATETWPTGLSVQYVYTTRGFPSQVKLLTATTGTVALAAGTVLWTAGTVNALGKAETQTLGNGVVSRASYDQFTGRIAALTAGAGSATNVLNYSYGWDRLGNLVTRADSNGDGSSGAVTENYGYDSINRLTSYEVSLPGNAAVSRTVSLQYNAIGNLLFKSDVGNYEYPAAGSTRPHAVTQIVGTSLGTVSYGYDANGNAKTASGQKWRSVSYTSFNLPDSGDGMAGASGSPRYAWKYDESHQRIVEIRSNPSGTRTTWYQHPDNAGGLSFESESGPSGTMQRHYVAVGGGTAVLVTSGTLPALAASDTAPPAISSIVLAKLEFWHEDHLGSLAATTDHTGAVTARYAYDPFGKRRYTNGQYDAAGNLVVDWSASAAGTDRGFTGHEHLDDIGVVHMNGRIFDPLIGRFMQPDPFIQDPSNLQNFNRYGYCFNSPLGCTDPTGMLSLSDLNPKRLLKGLEKGIRRFARDEIGNLLGNLGIGAASFLCGPYAPLCAGFGSAAWAGVAGADFDHALKAGLISGITVAGMKEIGARYAGFGQEGATSASILKNTIAHAAFGCATGAAAGSGCRGGALAGLVSAGIANYGHDIGIVMASDISVRYIQYAVIGGVASVAGGGRFDQGAITGAFGYLFNHWAHSLALAWDGIEAHQTLQKEYKWRSGYEAEASEVAGVGKVDGRFDSARDDGSLWEIKRNSDFGRTLGEKALAEYTRETGFHRGGDLPGLPVGGSLTLDGTRGGGIYRYTNMGNGLIVYDRVGTQPGSPIRIYVPSISPLPSRARRDPAGF